MALPLVSPITGLINLGIKVLEMSQPFVQEQYDLLMGCKAALRRLARLSKPIRIVLEAVDGGQMELTGGLLEVIQDFRGTLYEANEVLDRLKYLELQVKVSSSSNILHVLIRRRSVLGKLKHVVSNLEDHAQHVEFYNNLVRDQQQQQQQQREEASQTNERRTVPLLARKLFGLDSDTKEIVGWLHESCSDATDVVTLVSIVGTAGVGKTTLALCVYNDSGVGKSFEPRIWHDVSPQGKSLDSLQAAVNEKSESSKKKFLLALDDLQDKVCFQVFATLANGTRGSTILLTTRLHQLARTLATELVTQLGAEVKIKLKILKGLSIEDSFSLLKQNAFFDVDPDDYKNLHGIGKEIAQRLRHSPMAVKLVGSDLGNNLNTDYWKDVLDTSLSKLKDTKDKLMPSLHLSYCRLPEHLRPCLVYSTVFPRDHEFRRDDLVHMWMAAGLIKGSKDERLVVKGSCYFDELLSYNIFEQSSDGYIMHNLFHDLARSMSYGECSSLVGDKFTKDTEDRGMIISHLFVRTNNIDCLEKMSKFKNLRTLLILFDGYNPRYATKFKMIFKALKSIRVLIINVKDMDALPDEIGELQHLRYLKVHQPISGLPDSISKLYHLQILEIEKVSPFVLPRHMNTLISMRHLMVDSSISEMIAGIGKLVFIQELSFRVKRETGYKIEELTDLTKLRELKIRGLENVESSKQSTDIKLCEKVHLCKLELEWSSDHSTVRNSCQELDKEVLDCLRPPHSNLKELTIRRYMHSALANWMTGIEMNKLNWLEYVKFEDCLELKCLPSLGELPLLKYLHLKNMPLVDEIDCKGGFLQLQVLHISGFNTWKAWSNLEAVTANFCNRLCELRIEDCPVLEELPSLPFRLAKLSLKNVGLTAFPILRNQSSASSSSCPFSLSSLVISRCEALTSFDSLREALPHISSTEISGCSTLTIAVRSWIQGGLRVPDGHLKIL